MHCDSVFSVLPYIYVYDYIKAIFVHLGRNISKTSKGIDNREAVVISIFLSLYPPLLLAEAFHIRQGVLICLPKYKVGEANNY